MLLVVVPVILASALASVAEDQWVPRADMPTARGYLGVAVVNERVYAIGGSGPIGTNEEYDPSTNTWTTKASMPNPGQSFAIAVCDGKIYCIGGLSVGMSADNKVYNPANDFWENKSAMPTARYGFQANVVNSKIYCMGGVRWLGYNQGIEELSVNEVYDPASDSWTTEVPMPNPAVYVSAVVDSKIYYFGPNVTEIYDTGTGTWATGSPWHTNMTERGANGVTAAATATTGEFAPKRIYVYDGESLQIYNPQKDSWTFGLPPPANRQYLGIAVVNDQLYFIGGFTPNTHNIPGYFTYYQANEQYTPDGYGETQPTLSPSPTSGQDIASPQNAPMQLLPAIAVLCVALVVAGIIVFYRRGKGSWGGLYNQPTINI